MTIHCSNPTARTYDLENEKQPHRSTSACQSQVINTNLHIRRVRVPILFPQYSPMKVYRNFDTSA